MLHEGTFQLQTDLPSICCSLVTKSVSKLGENFETLSLVLKLKLKRMTSTVFQFFLRFDFCKIAKFQNFNAEQQEKLTKSFKILPRVGVFLSQGLCFCKKILPQGRAFDYLKTFRQGFALWGC